MNTADFCACGHLRSLHYAYRSLSPLIAQPCLVDGCDCEGLRHAEPAERAA